MRYQHAGLVSKILEKIDGMVVSSMTLEQRTEEFWRLRQAGTTYRKIPAELIPMGTVPRILELFEPVERLERYNELVAAFGRNDLKDLFAQLYDVQGMKGTPEIEVDDSDDDDVKFIPRPEPTEAPEEHNNQNHTADDGRVSSSEERPSKKAKVNSDSDGESSLSEYSYADGELGFDE